MSDFDFRARLQELTWEEGATLSAVIGSYRHETVVVCSKLGRQKAQFANGEFPYFAYVELLGAGNKRIEQGAGIVPVLPDGRLLMVVEQRAPQGKVADRPYTVVRKAGPSIDLRKMGVYSSLEFPGGAVDPADKSVKAGFLRELQQESGVETQTATLYRSLHPIYAFGADLAVKQYFGVAYLSGLRYEEYVHDDGGLYVVALTADDVHNNMINGVIVSGQSAGLQWNFYMEVERGLVNPQLMDRYFSAGYLVKEEVQLVKP